MSGSSHCNALSQNCALKCCNYFGFCPTVSQDCYYFYNNPINIIAVAVGVSIGGLVLIISIIIGSAVTGGGGRLLLLLPLSLGVAL